MSTVRTASGEPSQDFVPPAGPIVEPSPRWVRVKFGGEFVADSKQPLLVRDYVRGHLPTYYLPQQDVRMGVLEPAVPGQSAEGIAYWNLRAGDQVVENAAWSYVDPPPELAALKGYLTFSWRKNLTWYEEAEEVFAHARDPHHRVDVLRSTRHVRVVLGGTTLAETRQPALLFETGLPTRYYLSAKDVRMDLLEPTDRITLCPYKGQASYWSARIGDSLEKNLVWSYQDPLPECPKIRGLLCFFNEGVDLFVDGELQVRPQTPWSRG